MLVVFSDLHFVDGSAGDHNLPESAYKKALGMVGIDPGNPTATAEFFKARGVTELKILFLGDIFDVARSLNWFENVGNAGSDVRPWGTDEETWKFNEPRIVEKTRGILLQMIEPSLRGEPGQSISPLMDQAAVDKVFQVCALFRQLKSSLKAQGIEVDYRLVPGNHDRFLHVDQFSRQVVVDSLSLDDDAASGFSTSRTEQDYKVIATHGHAWDPLNFGRPTWKAESFVADAWAEPSFGEAVTIHVASKLSKYLKEESQERGVWAKSVQFAIENMDNIRPASALFDYLKTEEKLRGWIMDEIVNDTIRRIASEFSENRFVKESCRRLGTHLSWVQAVVPLPTLLGIFRWMKWDSLMTGVLAKGLGEQDDPTERLKALAESVYFNKYMATDLPPDQKDKPVWHLVYGHTHVPEVQPMRSGYPAALVVNTGTMRPRVFSYGTPGKPSHQFLRHKTLSFAVFYRDGERSSAGLQKEYEHFHLVASEVL